MTPDLDQAQRFLTLLDEGAETFRFRAIHPTRSRKPKSLGGSLEQCAPELSRLNAAGYGIYVVANHGGDDDDSIDRVRAVFADWDPPQTAAMPAQLPIEPHIIVESSEGKHHAYWLADGLPVDQFKAVQEAIAAMLGSDKTITNPSRIMRLPGFAHTKSAPRMVRIIHESGAVPYSASQVRETFAPTRQATASATGPTAGKMADGRRTDLYGCALDLFDMGYRDGELVEKLRRYNRATFEPPKPDAEVLEAARNAPKYAKRGRGDAAAPSVKSAAELMTRTFQPVQWAVRGILPEGVTILSGDPKIGKSWLLYQATIAVATGRPLWAGREPEEAGDALYLALEDNDRRMQRRLQVQLPHFATYERGGRIVYPDLSRLHYVTDWPRAEAGVALVASWLREHPSCRLVVVDTVSAFRDPEPGKKSAYAHDYAVGEMFKPLAREFSCAVVLVMHNRKQHSADALQLVSGTQGMTGSVDNVLVLKRERGTKGAGLYVDGRDIEEPQELALQFHDGHWSSDGRSVDDVRMSKERRQVLEAVAALGEKSAR